MTASRSSPSDALFRRNPEALTRCTPRSVLISTAPDSDVLQLTGVAMLLWTCLSDDRTTDTLIDDAATRAGVPRTSVEEPALDALHRLVDAGAVVSR